ncbi:MAG: hypothetical protein ASARMPRED_008650 [Alectoria sarmentosa]|nr:MAG: hypothetical protein ASARMPRED_008650 [Alectoria sarmentosa]
MAAVTKGEDRETMKTEQDAKITLYWLEKSRSQRILWLLTELDVPYDLQTYKRQSMLAPPELKEIHPLGKSPLVTISTPSAAPLVLAESSFIVEYIIDHFGPRFAPTRETSDIKTSSPFFLRPLALLITGAVESKFLRPNLASNFDFLEHQLATSPDHGSYLCGANLTGADIMMSFPLGAAKSRALFTATEHPKLCAYVDRLEATEGFRKAVQKIVEVEGSYEGL